MEKLHKKIDNLSKATTQGDLVKRMQAILNEMAYYISQSETIVNDSREGWRDEYTDSLYHDAVSNQNETRGSLPDFARMGSQKRVEQFKARDAVLNETKSRREKQKQASEIPPRMA